MKHLLLALLIPLNFTARDPFRWPTIVPITYQLIGISFNSKTTQYTALLRCNSTTYFVHLHDILPDKSKVTAITHDNVQLTHDSRSVTLRLT